MRVVDDGRVLQGERSELKFFGVGLLDGSGLWLFLDLLILGIEGKEQVILLVNLGLAAFLPSEVVPIGLVEQLHSQWSYIEFELGEMADDVALQLAARSIPRLARLLRPVPGGYLQDLLVSFHAFF
jgi:hypothetical protein